MKVKIICFLAVKSIFIWGHVDASDAFEDLAKELIEKSDQRFIASKENKSDPIEVYRSDPEAYAEKFKQFLRNFDSGDRAISDNFFDLGFYAWEGHYITRTLLNQNLRNSISLRATQFQDVHFKNIDSKNILILYKIRAHFAEWSSAMLVLTAYHPDQNMEKFRILFTEALLALEDMMNVDKDLPVFFVYFYQILKRLKNTEVIHKDLFISEYISRLTNYIFNDAEVVNDKVTTSCCCKKGGIPGHVKNKLKLLKSKRNLWAQFEIDDYDEVSNEFKNLHFSVFEEAPVKFPIKDIVKLFDIYYSSYSKEKLNDPTFRVVRVGQVFLTKLFTEEPSNYKLEYYPPIQIQL